MSDSIGFIASWWFVFVVLIAYIYSRIFSFFDYEKEPGQVRPQIMKWVVIIGWPLFLSILISIGVVQLWKRIDRGLNSLLNVKYK